MRKRIGTAVDATAVVLAATVAVIPALAQPAGPKGPVAPGPELLYADAPYAPQLENTGIWTADPIGICHTSAYRDGEYVHQGCVYDDQGGGNQYRWPNDTYLRNYTYPEAAAYRRNAADILEVRVKPVEGGTAFRVTLNTMVDPELYGITLALGDSDDPAAAPHGANTVLPAQRFVTVHGSQGDIVDAATGETLAESPDVSVDVERRQVEILVPDSAFAADGEQRIAAAAGLWGDGGYLVPQLTADETHPAARSSATRRRRRSSTARSGSTSPSRRPTATTTRSGPSPTATSARSSPPSTSTGWPPARTTRPASPPPAT